MFYAFRVVLFPEIQQGYFMHYALCSLPQEIYLQLFLYDQDRKSSNWLSITRAVSTFSRVCKELHAKIDNQFWSSLIQTVGPQSLRLRHLACSPDADWQALARERFQALKLIPWVDNTPSYQERTFPGSFFQDAFMTRNGIEHYKIGQFCSRSIINFKNGFDQALPDETCHLH